MPSPAEREAAARARQAERELMSREVQVVDDGRLRAAAQGLPLGPGNVDISEAVSRALSRHGGRRERVQTVVGTVVQAINRAATGAAPRDEVKAWKAGLARSGAIGDLLREVTGGSLGRDAQTAVDKRTEDAGGHDGGAAGASMRGAAREQGTIDPYRELAVIAGRELGMGAGREGSL